MGKFGGAPSVTLRDLARPLSPADLEALRAKREQDERDSAERERTFVAKRDCSDQRDYLRRCDTYTLPKTHYARASRLVAARGVEPADTYAHIVPPAHSPEGRLRAAACGTVPGAKTNSVGWGRTVSMATCKWCLLAAGEPRVGWHGPGTGDKYRCH